MCVWGGERDKNKELTKKQKHDLKKGKYTERDGKEREVRKKRERGKGIKVRKRGKRKNVREQERERERVEEEGKDNS